MVLLDWLPLAALRSLTFHFLCSFFRKLLVDWFLMLFFSPKIIGVNWLVVAAIFVLIRVVGGVAVHFQKLLLWGWIVCKRYTLRCMDYHLKMLLLYSLLRLVGGLVAAGYSGHVS